MQLPVCISSLRHRSQVVVTVVVVSSFSLGVQFCTWSLFMVIDCGPRCVVVTVLL